MSDYTAWRITYQDAEKAARAAFDRAGELAAEVDRLEERIEFLEDWCSNATAQRVIELEAEVANYLNNGDIKLRERIKELENEVRRLTDTNAILTEQNKRLIDCYDIKASVSAERRAEDFSRWMGKPLTRYAKKELAKHFEAHGLASDAKCDTGNT